jgi:hypothetical protein
MWQQNNLTYTGYVRSVTSLSQKQSEIHEEFNLFIYNFVVPIDIQFSEQIMKYFATY